MTSLLQKALTGAVTAVARDDNNSLAPKDATVVAQAIAQKLPEPKALESLWPQMARYAISGFGVALAARGLGTEVEWNVLANSIIDVATGAGDAADWKVVVGGIIALAPPTYRAVSTWLARLPG